nr:immunoglobulin light chain junction region [Macaca mulatta]MOY02516.1 immunoglobulin light chain junction region [Macaca mulatta]
CMQPLEFPWAF